ncbi:hypothetical protein DBR45_52510 [Pseudomonas sp. HMWF031]|nr:hypothetical protein DBR45_52510 [Pseudomonas sp. HMWF031]
MVAGVAERIGKEKVGVRFAPLFSSTDEERTYLGMAEDDPLLPTSKRSKYLRMLALLSSSSPKRTGIMHRTKRHAFARFRTGRPCRFGRTFMANLDLPARIANEWPLNPLSSATVYGGNAEGYTDYSVYGG